ncbi:hypothetical protein F5Y04DRAFT_284808 [Hypomontagnella monticulosa]|nr:hypothetical protein F5Y04DRAFT_284808 [Hypomontagnella monticulosa]
MCYLPLVSRSDYQTVILDTAMNQSVLVPSLIPTGPGIITLEWFYGVIWGSFALCVLAFGGRITIRITCFNRLFFEDYFMLLSLCFLFATAVIGQLFLKDMYNMVAVCNGTTPSPDFMSDSTKALRSFGTLIILDYCGIWLVKFNFLLFFWRLGNHVHKYRVFWWIVMIFNIAVGAILIGLIDFECLFSPAEVVFATCNTAEKATSSYTMARVSSALDAFGDAMILGFPIWILWGCKLSLRTKFALSCIFGLTTFTITATIYRGWMFRRVYGSISENDMKELNIVSVWYIFNLEFFLGCLVSFRALFAEGGNSTNEANLREHQRRAALRNGSGAKGLYARVRSLQEDLITTFMTWEATTRADDDLFNLPHPPTGRLSLDFERENTYSESPKPAPERSSS